MAGFGAGHSQARLSFGLPVWNNVLRESLLSQFRLNLAKHLVLCLSWLGQRWTYATTDAGRHVNHAHGIASDSSIRLNFDVFEFQHGVCSGLRS